MKIRPDFSDYMTNDFPASMNQRYTQFLIMFTKPDKLSD